MAMELRMTTSANLVTVNNALEKLEFLARNRTASERGGYKNNWSAFAGRIAQVRCDRCFDQEVVKNYRNTLRTSAQNDRIDADTEKIIAELCRFDMRSIAWRSESAKTFKDDYLKARFRLNRRYSFL
jgi:hypothetical protein